MTHILQVIILEELFATLLYPYGLPTLLRDHFQDMHPPAIIIFISCKRNSMQMVSRLRRLSGCRWLQAPGSRGRMLPSLHPHRGRSPEGCMSCWLRCAQILRIRTSLSGTRSRRSFRSCPLLLPAASMRGQPEYCSRYL